MKIAISVLRRTLRCAWAALLLSGLSGAGGCARSVNDYLAEARSGAPLSVKDAVVAIGQILYKKESAGIPYDRADEEAILYLKDVASSNSVPMNRAAAMAALGPLRRAKAQEVFLAGLRDSFWLVRFEAARGLGREAAEKNSEPLRELLGTETRSEVRLEIVKSLGQIGGPVALRTLIEVFLRRGEGGLDPQVLAYLAIRDKSGMNYGFDEVRKWEEYYRSKFGELPGDRRAKPSPPQENAGAEEGRPQSQEKEPPEKKKEDAAEAEKEPGKAERSPGQ